MRYTAINGEVSRRPVGGQRRSTPGRIGAAATPDKPDRPIPSRPISADPLVRGPKTLIAPVRARRSAETGSTNPGAEHHDAPAPPPARWSRAFEGDASAVGGVRRFVTDVVVGEHVAARASELMDDLALLASELAANAVLHAGGGFAVTVSLQPAMVRLEVADESDSLPRRRDPAPHQPGGRGYQIIEALAERWGCTKLPVGKSVWAEVPVGRLDRSGLTPPATNGGDAAEAAREPSSGDPPASPSR